MKKIAFCYDGRLKMDEEGNMYPQAFTEDVLNRYLFFGDTIDLFCRKKIINNDNSKYKLPEKARKKINIVECPELMTIKGFLYENRNFEKNVIAKRVKEADFCIIRMPSFVGRKALKICNKENKKYLVEMVGDPFDSYWNYSLAGKILAPISYFKNRLSLRKAKYVQYVSNEFLQKRYPTNGYSIACSDVNLTENMEEILTKRKNKILSKHRDEKIILGTLGAIDVKYKGQEYIIKAIEKLKKMGYSNFEYQLVGGGNPERLQKIGQKLNVQNDIKFIGAKSHDEVFAWLDNIDIYIQPSNTEGLPRAVIEAMSRACPCIVSNAGGNPELINFEYVFKKKNINSLINKIIRLTSDNDILINEAQINYHNSKNFEKKVLDKKREEFYNVVLKS